MSLPITSSITTVSTEISGSLSGSMKYVNIGGGAIRRKLDRSVVPSVWNELWVGIMFGWKPPYILSNREGYNTGIDSVGYNNLFAFGLVHSSGSIPEDYISGSVKPDTTTACSHSVYVSMINNYFHYTSSNGTSHLRTAPVPQQNVNGTITSGGGSTNTLFVADPGYWKYIFLVLTRNTASLDCEMTVTLRGYDYSLEEPNPTPLTGSALLATAFTNTTVIEANYTITPNALGSTAVIFPVTESMYGELDEVFISWASEFCPLRIGAVVVRYVS